MAYMLHIIFVNLKNKLMYVLYVLYVLYVKNKEIILVKLNFKKHVLPAATILAAVVAMPAQANYVCTGNAGSANNSTPYFNGDLTDTRCDISEVNIALGITVDESLIVGSKSDSVGDPITSWSQGEFGLGTLTVTDISSTSGTWSLTGGGTPLFFVDKYNGGYDIFTYMGLGTDPFADSWNGLLRGTVGATCADINCNATTSHISVYGVVPIPAAVWLFGSGLLGLVGVARRKRA